MRFLLNTHRIIYTFFKKKALLCHEKKSKYRKRLRYFLRKKEKYI